MAIHIPGHISSGSRRWAVPLALLGWLGMLAVAPPRAGALPQDRERVAGEVGLHGAGVVGHRVPGLEAAAAQLVELRLSWPLSPRWRLGCRVESPLAFWHAEPEGQKWAWLPSAALLLQARLWRWIELDLTVGLGAPYHLRLDDGLHLLLTAGVGAALFVVRHRRVHLALRVGFEAMLVPTDARLPVLLVPTAGLLLRFPVHSQPPALHAEDVPEPFFMERFRRRPF